MKYRAGYKYQLAENEVTQTNIIPTQAVKTEYIELTIWGQLTVKEGYAWDGPSGPTIDTNSFMRGSLVHDALYQLIREKHLLLKNKAKADLLLYKLCREDGMWLLRALLVYYGVKWCGGSSVRPSAEKVILQAP